MKKVTVVAFALGCGMSAAYADDNTFDPRAVAMGGTGVTTSNTRNAVFENPAMLASNPRDTVAIEIPILSARLQDQNQLLSNVNNLKSDANNLTNSIQSFQANPNPGSAAAAASALNKFNSSIQAASGKSLMADLFAGTVVGVPSKNLGIAVYADVRAEVGAMFNYAAADQSTITNLENNLNNCAAGNPSACTAAQSATSGGKVNGLQSQMLVRGVTIKELGASVAHHFESLDNIDIGITPKMQQIATYDYALDPQQGSGISLNQGKNTGSDFNVDLGASKTFQTESGNEYKAGAVAKNMMSKSFTTVLGDHIDIKPQLAVGGSYLTKLTTVGVDLDVISNKPIINGISKESQYLRFGAEFDAWRWAQSRWLAS